jgi:outer membrane protein assembly factor BamE (lipoprotein component of BamABCDE complex)
MNDSRPQFIGALFVWLALGLGGCAGTPPPEQEPQDRLTVGKVQGEIKVGMSGAAVVEVLGSPNIITTDELRRESWVYDKISTEHMEASRSSYGTLILVGGSEGSSRTTTRQRTLTVIIKFDEQKLVRDFAYNYTQF